REAGARARQARGVVGGASTSRSTWAACGSAQLLDVDGPDAVGLTDRQHAQARAGGQLLEAQLGAHEGERADLAAQVQLFHHQTMTRSAAKIASSSSSAGVSSSGRI